MSPGRAGAGTVVGPAGPAGAARLNTWLCRPVSGRRRVLGWLVATALLFASLALWYEVEHGPGGPLTPTGDTWESAVPALAIEHGLVQCTYPPRAASAVPPLYPLIAAGILILTRAGNGAVPVTWEPGVACDHPGARGSAQASEWPFLLTGLVGWPVLGAGAILLLGAAGIARTRWEMFTLSLIAVLPASAGALVAFFHPEDLLALGFLLAAVAGAARGRWAMAGVCIGLACCSKQFALLALVPLVVATPRGARRRFAVGCVATAGIVVVPLLVGAGRGMVKSLLGGYATAEGSGTVVDSFHLHGALLTVVARVGPLLAAAALAAAARVRWGSALRQPAVLSALVVSCLALRLLFEVNLIGYYFLAGAVGIVVVDALSRRARGWTFGWLVAAAAFYPPAYEPLVSMRERAPLLFQMALVGWLLALSLGVLWRTGVPSEATAAGSLGSPGIGAVRAALPLR